MARDKKQTDHQRTTDDSGISRRGFLGGLAAGAGAIAAAPLVGASAAKPAGSTANLAPAILKHRGETPPVVTTFSLSAPIRRVLNTPPYQRSSYLTASASLPAE